MLSLWRWLSLAVAAMMLPGVLLLPPVGLATADGGRRPGADWPETEVPEPSVPNEVSAGPVVADNMPGGGYEMQFSYEIPPQFLSVVPR